MEVAFIGNHSAGKSTILSALTGDDKKVIGWAGAISSINIVELPGIYSLSSSDNLSADEKEVREGIIRGDFDLILNVVDSTNLDRGLYLTVQLLEMGVPVVLVLSKRDLALRQSINIDAHKLSKIMHIAVLQVNSASDSDIQKLKELIMHKVAQGLAENATANTKLYALKVLSKHYPTMLVHTIQSMAKLLGGGLAGQQHAIRLLEGGERYLDDAGEHKTALQQYIKKLERHFGEDADMVVMEARYEYISILIEKCVSKGDSKQVSITSRIDAIVLNSYLSIPIFLVCMYVVFAFSIMVGGRLQQIFNNGADFVLITTLGNFLESQAVSAWLISILRDGLGQAIKTVISFIPLIATSYFCMITLESSGYMARVAFIVERFFRKFNMSGKAIIPMVLGFGCNVPAIMSTRILENRSDRIATIMMIPFMSCSARLTVYTLFGTLFFGEHALNITFTLYITGILTALFTGFAIKRYIFQSQPGELVMELPPYHFPALSSIASITLYRLKDFVLGAGKVIIITCFALQLLFSFKSDGTFIHNKLEDSVLADMGKGLAAMLSPMGVDRNNWVAAVALVGGIAAKEVVIGTLSILHHQTAGDTNFQIKQCKEQGAMPINIGERRVDDAMVKNGNWYEVQASKEGAVSDSVFHAKIAESFNGAIGAFAYMLFILLYFPCISVFAIISKEIGIRWAIISALWSTGFAYIVATAFYQIAIHV